MIKALDLLTPAVYVLQGKLFATISAAVSKKYKLASTKRHAVSSYTCIGCM